MFWAVAALIVIAGAIAWAVRERTYRKEAETTAEITSGIALRAASDAHRRDRVIALHRRKTKELYDIIQKLDPRDRGAVAVDGLNELLRFVPQEANADSGDEDEMSDGTPADTA